MRECREAEGRRNATVRVQVGAGELARPPVFAVPDYDDMRVNKIDPQSGAWPPPEHEVLIERSSLALIGAQVGDTV